MGSDPLNDRVAFYSGGDPKRVHNIRRPIQSQSIPTPTGKPFNISRIVTWLASDGEQTPSRSGLSHQLRALRPAQRTGIFCPSTGWLQSTRSCRCTESAPIPDGLHFLPMST